MNLWNNIYYLDDNCAVGISPDMPNWNKIDNIKPTDISKLHYRGDYSEYETYSRFDAVYFLKQA